MGCVSVKAAAHQSSLKEAAGKHKRTISGIRLTYFTTFNEDNTQIVHMGSRLTVDCSHDDSCDMKKCSLFYSRQTTTVSLDDERIDVCKTSKEIAKYCLPLLTAYFIGQTTTATINHIDEADTKEVLNLGTYISMIDHFLRIFQSVKEFTGNEGIYVNLLQEISKKRRLVATETEEQAYERLLADSKRFVKIYHQRGVPSQEIHHKKYWGSRQQLLAGKVIADWVDKDNGPLDPVFGVLLNPIAGRAGPGDSSWFHHLVFDDIGHMAYHSAVHDAFGYLLNSHNVGPGYDYMHHSYLNKASPLAGQLDGMNFWKKVVKSIKVKQHDSATTGQHDAFNEEYDRNTHL